MDRTEILVMAGFCALLLLGLILGLRQGARVRAQARAYAAAHGWAMIPDRDETLASMLAELAPDERWFPGRVTLAEPMPSGLYLFGYQASNKRGNSRQTLNGTAALAAHTGPPCPMPVVIVPRVPLLNKMLDDQVPVGGGEFRDRWTVMCKDASTAGTVVTPAVENLLMEHARSPGWNLTTVIAGREALVYSFWAVTNQDWDYLLDLARKLRQATARQSAW